MRLDRSGLSSETLESGPTTPILRIGSPVITEGFLNEDRVGASDRDAPLAEKLYRKAVLVELCSAFPAASLSFSLSRAWAAASRAMGIRMGEQLT